MATPTRRTRGPELVGLENADEPVTDLTVDVYLRSLSPPFGAHAAQRSCLETLTGLYEEGKLAGLRVSVWGDRLCLCESCTSTRTARAILDAVETFEEWASDATRDVELPLDRRDIRSTYAGDDREVLSLPGILLAVYADTSLIAVFPHTDSDATYSVSDGVEAVTRLLRSDRSDRSVPAE